MNNMKKNDFLENYIIDFHNNKLMNDSKSVQSIMI